MNNANKNKMFVVDYDGTLATSEGYVNKNTIKKFEEIEHKNIIRVINTGRSLFSLRNVIDDDFPVDYVVFSAGIGIYDWKNKIILQSYSLTVSDTAEIYNFLCKHKYDFMVQLPVPDNHYFHHFGNIKNNSDFRTRINNYESYGISSINECPTQASQFVIICAKNTDYYNQIKSRFMKVNVIKATSPINHKSIWVEILPANVSKASGIEFIRRKLNIDINNIVAVGNDYYDLDMLEYVNKNNAYIVSNAPKEMKPLFNLIESNDENAIAKLIDSIY